MNNLDPKLIKWLKWLDIIYKDLQSIEINRHIFWKTQEIIKNNPDIQGPDDFNRFLAQGYIAASVMGVRRQIKIKDNSISFARLLKDISENPKIITRNYFVSLYKSNPTSLPWANKDFDKFAGTNEPFISAKMVEADLNKLKTEVIHIESYADKILAHIDVSKPKIMPSFSELDKCIDYLTNLFKKYYLVFTGSSLISMLPAYQYDWTRIFNVAWIQGEDQG